MNNLREKINVALDVYDEYNVSEAVQSKILTNGVDVKVSRYEIEPLYYHFDFIRFAEFIKYMQKEWLDGFGERFDVNKFLMSSDHTGYMQPFQLFAAYKKKSKTR